MNEVVKHKSQRSETVSTPNNWRIAFPFLHKQREKRANGAALLKPRFDAVLIAPKQGAADVCPNYKLLSSLCMQAATKAWQSWPQGGHWPIQDGDVPYTPKPPAPGQPAVAVDPTKYAWRKNNWIIEVTNYFEAGPKVAILQNGAIVDLPAQTFNGKQCYKSGDFVIANISAHTFHREKYGVNFGFDGVLIVGEGEAIGAGGPKSAQEMFAGAVAPVGIPPAGGPQMPGPAYTAPGGPPMPPGPVPAMQTAPVAPIQTAPVVPQQYAAPIQTVTPPGPVAPAPVLPPMPPGVGAPGPLPAFPPR